MKAIAIVSTYPDRRSITKVADELVRSKTVACVNITKISSVYAWQGKIENSAEYLAIFKTTPKNKKLLKQKIKETHPYDVPEIAELDIKSMNQPYLRWLAESTI